MSDWKCEVVRIKKVETHPNADRLDICTVFDYPVVSVRGDYKEGDLAVYVPIDSVVPSTPEFQFIHGGAGDTRHCRIKAKKLRGVFSMGFLHKGLDSDGTRVILHALQTDTDGTIISVSAKFVEGEDAAEFLGIIKYEPPEPKVKGFSFGRGESRMEVPGFPKYTDIENFRRYSDIFTPGELIVATEKLHGCNFRCGWLDGEFHVGSHNAFRASAGEGFDCKACKGTGMMEDSEPREDGSITCARCQGKGRISDYHDSGQNENIWWRAVNQYNLKEKLSVLPGVLLYGEVYGDVQDLKYGHKPGEISFAAIDMFEHGMYKNFYDCTALCSDLMIPTVPVVLDSEPYFKDAVVANATGFSLCSRGVLQMREGIVVKPVRETMTHFGRKILKVINPAYLLRTGGSEAH